MNKNSFKKENKASQAYEMVYQARSLLPSLTT